jgi:hypothetical protein
MKIPEKEPLFKKGDIIKFTFKDIYYTHIRKGRIGTIIKCTGYSLGRWVYEIKFKHEITYFFEYQLTKIK